MAKHNRLQTSSSFKIGWCTGAAQDFFK